MRISPRGAVSRRLVIGLGIGLAAILAIASSQTCLRVAFRTGLWLDECPDGELRQTISIWAPELKRGADGLVTVSVNATYLVAPNDMRHTETITRFTPTVSLVSAVGETQLAPKKNWEKKIGRAHV